jgi:threonine dehydratase
MLTIDNVTYRIGGREILRGASARLPAGRCIGLVGRNGAGKSTLLKLILGEAHVDLGEISKPSAWRVGALAQEAPSGPKSLLDTVLAAVGGGGLIGGIAAYFSGRVRVVGVEPEASPTLAWAMREGKPVDAPAEGYAADSLAPKRVGKIPFEIARRYVDRIVLVSDDEIRAAQIALWQNLRIVAEPGGSAAFAAPLSRRYVPEANERVAVIISGGNTDAVKF